MFYWFAYCIVKTLGAIFSPRTVVGSANIPQDGAFIIAGNHLSIIDPFLIGLSLRRRISYMAKDALFHNQILKWMLQNVEAFPIRRGSADVWALRETLRRLKRGMPVVMFPEGTRKTSTMENKMQSGIGFLAVKGNVPIVPVHIKGSDKVLPPGAKLPKRNRVTISFGKPLIFSDEQSYSEIVTQVMNEILTLG
jgi:1-acyl-sn-glycerol-3-phosphate acyltransferase